VRARPRLWAGAGAGVHNARRLGNLGELCTRGGRERLTSRGDRPDLDHLCTSAGRGAALQGPTAAAGAHNARRLGNLGELCTRGGRSALTSRGDRPDLGDLNASEGRGAALSAGTAPEGVHNSRRLGNLGE